MVDLAIDGTLTCGGVGELLTVSTRNGSTEISWIDVRQHSERATQCPNCGAPAKERECAYCGSILWN